MTELRFDCDRCGNSFLLPVDSAYINYRSGMMTAECPFCKRTTRNVSWSDDMEDVARAQEKSRRGAP